jgi:tricorn protease
MRNHTLPGLFLLASVCGTAASLSQHAAAQASPHAGMMRFPDVSKDSIVFVYANDLWIVGRDGGMARPLASPAGPEMMPRFSHDGKTIAFTGNYDGGRDIYTMSVDALSTGAVPARVTHHPSAEMVSEWTPDGKVLFISNGLAGLARQSQLFTVSAAGGLPQRVPVPYGSFASISPDGTWLAYIPHSTDFRTWKRYRGGMATDIWLFNLKDKSSKRATTWEGTDSFPMWIPGGDSKTMYFVSDAGPEHRLNIWKHDVASGERTQVTNFRDFDVKFPSMGPGPGGKGEIVFQLGSDLRLLDLATGQDRAVKVTIPGDRPALRPQMVNAAQNITGGSISPSGKRVAVSARGDLWSAPAKEGAVRQMTHTDGVFERDPAWSPDGKWIAYFSDEGGEYDLFIRPSDARPERRRRTTRRMKRRPTRRRTRTQPTRPQTQRRTTRLTRQKRSPQPPRAAFVGEVKSSRTWAPASLPPTWSPTVSPYFSTTTADASTSQPSRAARQGHRHRPWAEPGGPVAHSTGSPTPRAIAQPAGHHLALQRQGR